MIIRRYAAAVAFIAVILCNGVSQDRPAITGEWQVAFGAAGLASLNWSDVRPALASIGGRTETCLEYRAASPFLGRIGVDAHAWAPSVFDEYVTYRYRGFWGMGLSLLAGTRLGLASGELVLLAGAGLSLEEDTGTPLVSAALSGLAEIGYGVRLAQSSIPGMTLRLSMPLSFTPRGSTFMVAAGLQAGLSMPLAKKATP